MLLLEEEGARKLTEGALLIFASKNMKERELIYGTFGTFWGECLSVPKYVKKKVIRMLNKMKKKRG